MIPRLRMLAGPNGSGKSTIAKQLADDYAVNLSKFLNADMLFAEIAESCKTACPFSIDNRELLDCDMQCCTILPQAGGNSINC